MVADHGKVSNSADGAIKNQGVDPIPSATGAVAAARTTRSPLPSGGDIIFVCLIYLLLVLLPNFVFGDGSTGWHLVSGQYIIDTLRVPHQDLISYTFPQKAWVPYEWFFDAIAAALVRLGGLRLLAVATATFIGWLFASLYGDARRAGCHFLIAMAVVLVAAMTSSVHWLARPHLFTFLGVYIFARVLEAFHRNLLSPRLATTIFGLTMLVWSNAHPGFLVGFAMVIIYLAGEVLTTAAQPAGEALRLTWKRAATLMVSLPIMAAASLLNPDGVGLYHHIAADLRPGPDSLVGAFQEFMPPAFHAGEGHAVSLELLFAAIVIGLAISRRKPWLGQLLLVLAFAHLALSWVRNEPLFAIVSVPLIAELFANSLAGPAGNTGISSPRWLDRLKQRTRGTTFDEMEARCTMHLVPSALVAVLAVSCIAAGRFPGVHALGSSRFDPKTKPTTTLEYIANSRLPWNRGFNFDNWGGYIRYTTGQRVFIDDRLDFYGEDFYRRYVNTLTIEPGWPRLLDEYRVEWVLLPKNAPLASMLKQTAGWQLRAEDPAADLFVRHPVVPSHQGP